MTRRAIPRSTDGVVADVALASGEVVYDAIARSLRMGDGATAGGLLLDPANAPLVSKFGADPTGVTDSYAAFAAAIADLPSGGGTIRVPSGTWKLMTQLTWAGKSIIWDIAPDAVFTGDGTGQGKFPYMNTNSAQLAVGPFVQSYTYQKSTHPNGGVAAFNVEMIQPDDYGAGQSVALFAGARATCDDPGANTWGINVVVGVLDTAEGTHQGIEIDIDTNSTLATTKGLAITGGGLANADVAIEIDRAAMKWDIGISFSHCLNGIFMTPVTGGTGITLHGAGVQAVGIAGTNLTVMQLDNGKDAVLLQRITDLTPAGYFLRAVNQANNANLFSIDVAGNMQFAGTFKGAIYPEYADNAAALAGGLTAGQHYRTGDNVKQVH